MLHDKFGNVMSKAAAERAAQKQAREAARMARAIKASLLLYVCTYKSLITVQGDFASLLHTCFVCLAHPQRMLNISRTEDKSMEDTDTFLPLCVPCGKQWRNRILLRTSCFLRA